MVCVECNTAITEHNAGTSENPLCDKCFNKLANDYAVPSQAKTNSNKAPLWLLVIGYFFSILGGLIGLCIGFNIIGKVKTNGCNVYKYDENSRFHGWIMISISFIVLFFVNFSRAYYK